MSSKEEFAMYFFGILLCFHAFIQIAILFARILDQLDNNDASDTPVSTKINYKARFEEIVGDAEKKESYNTMAIEAAVDTTETEEAWKRRILMEYVSGYGNIIMIYDFYRRGFCYYCDLSSVPYTVLIVIAYRYMITYKCVSFADTPVEENTKDEAVAPPAQKRTEYKVNSLEAKLRATETEGRTPDVTKEKAATEAAQPCVKFIRLGKVCDFSFLAKPVAKVAMIETKQISYKDFISMRRPVG